MLWKGSAMLFSFDTSSLLDDLFSSAIFWSFLTMTKILSSHWTFPPFQRLLCISFLLVILYYNISSCLSIVFWKFIYFFYIVEYISGIRPRQIADPQIFLIMRRQFYDLIQQLPAAGPSPLQPPDMCAAANAAAFGFNHLSYFPKNFCKTYVCTPREYRGRRQ